MADLSKQNIRLGSAIVATVTMCGWCIWLGGQNANLEGQIKSLTTTAGDHETRIRTIEGGVSEIRTDVKWIRSELERRRP